MKTGHSGDWRWYSVKLFDYDYDDLAHQVQTGLERLGINFLRGHMARIHRDLVDFHGYEQVDLELAYDGHTLKIHQVGRPRGPGVSAPEAPPGALEEAFESTFDGWPASEVPHEQIARWLASLPPGEAAPERPRAALDATNPFAAERPPSQPRTEQPAVNPFLADQPKQGGPNPFLDTDRERKRREILRRLKGDDED